MAGEPETLAQADDHADLNRGFYDALWSQTYLACPERFNTWPLVAALLLGAPQRLEVGPGLRPRLPVAGTHFIDLSAPVIERLNAHGAQAQRGEVGALPFRDASFDLVCAFDVLEHVVDDARAWSELGRVLRPDGVLVLSVPLHAGYWTEFDELVGHVRRYHPGELTGILRRSGLFPEKVAPFGMQPNNPALLRIGMWFLKHQRRAALFWYNLVFLPLGILFQKPLRFQDGFPPVAELAQVAEIVLVCRKGAGS